ncbi:hypothetical protein [Okeania sp. SIO2B3]|uniref:hypothetical protein n=1 Tax=Okeania sp. SIO2B3 TaxID=2607784 RepID=UPI0013C0D454|nr:hypothetical protein [Okeania sp. SIO2B3]NET40572.1 hypothetical protein [Okeania sp. SIO2B3]
MHADGSGLMECVHSSVAREYVFGGEYELRLSEIVSPDDDDEYIDYDEWLALTEGRDVEKPGDG